MAEKKDNNRVPEAELILPRGKKVILQAEDTDYKRGLIVELLDNGGYEMAYWYDKPDKPYPVEILVDGQSIKPDGKIVEMKFHPQDYYDEQDELNEVTRYSGFNRNPEDPDSESFKPTGSVSEFKEDLRALFGKFKGDLRNPEFIRGVAQIMVNWKSLLRSQLQEVRYSRFKKEAKLRTPTEQIHRAVREIRQRMNEMLKIVGHTERMKNELKQSNEGMSYLKRTKNALGSISEKLQELTNRIKGLTE